MEVQTQHVRVGLQRGAQPEFPGIYHRAGAGEVRSRQGSLLIFTCAKYKPQLNNNRSNKMHNKLKKCQTKANFNTKKAPGGRPRREID